MRTEPWIIVGAGGHARVVMDALQCEKGESFYCSFVDDNVSMYGQFVLDRLVFGPVTEVVSPGMRFHVAIGLNSLRENMHQLMLEIGAVPFAVAHPAAIVSKYAVLGDASFVAARAVVAPASKIGTGAIINHGVVIDHDCVVGDFAHVAPGATLGGGVKVGRGALIGAGANVLPGVSIGESSVVGAGAVVTKNIPDLTRAIGVPALFQKVTNG